MADPIRLTAGQVDDANMAFGQIIFDPLQNHEVACIDDDMAGLVSWSIDKLKESAQTRFLLGREQDPIGVFIRDQDQSKKGRQTSEIYRFSIALDKAAVTAFIQKYCPSST